MLKSNNTFLIVYGNGQFVKWKIWEKCVIWLEKTGNREYYKIFLNLSKIVECYNL